MESLKQIIQSLQVSAEQKEQLSKELKVVQKKIDSAEFRYKRTLMDKEAITNILNASIGEIEKQKKIIEDAKNEINKTLLELDTQKKSSRRKKQGAEPGAYQPPGYTAPTHSIRKNGLTW